MAGYPCLVIELTTKTSTGYYGTHNFYTGAADTPASTFFEARLKNDVEFDRSVGTFFWGQRSRGAQNFGVIDLVNADGAFDSYVGSSLRDKSLVIKRGESLDAYSTFTTVATLVVDRIEFPDELTFRIYAKDLSAKLERAIQSTLYPTTISQLSLRGKPRPITVGKCYQVPLQQPDMYGNGRYDVHDGDQWIGVDQMLDQGLPMIEATAYERCRTSGIYGVERLNAIGGKQAASVAGAFTIISTDISDDFASLAGWTEVNGGAGGRDASIVSNACRLLNTLGGADLHIDSTTTLTSVITDFWYYEFDCTIWVSGSATLRTASGSIERTIDKAGRYTGIVRSSANWSPSFYAANGSNCDLTIDTFRVRKVRLTEKLSDWLTYACVTKGPLSSGDLDSSVISALETAAGYSLGFYASEPTQIADLLDATMASFGGWWYITRLGKLTVGRLLDPTGTSLWSFDSSNIKAGMQVRFDAAPGLSNVILAKRNWLPYSEGELVTTLNYVQLNSSDKDADVTLATDLYSYTATNVGSVRDTPALFGERYYFEVKATAVDGAATHYIGAANASAAIASYPGSDANCIAYRANGKSVLSAAETSYGSTWAANDYIGVAIDARPAANGSKRQHFRVYFSKNGAWQNSSNPTTEAASLNLAVGAAGIAYLMTGCNVAGTNSGAVNFGQSAFIYAPPDDYLAPAWHRQTVMQNFRYRYQSTGSLFASYVHANAADGARDSIADQQPGIATLLSKEIDARTECDRWVTLYSVERFFYTFDALLDGGVNADQIEPGDIIDVTYPRFGLSAKKMQVCAVKGEMLGRFVTITAWG